MLISCGCPGQCFVHATTIPCRWPACRADRGETCVYRNGRHKPNAHAVREKTQQRGLYPARNAEGRRWLDKTFGPAPPSLPVTK